MTTNPQLKTTKATPVHYKTVRIDELDVFYREAGSESSPVLLLLHGFPTSSNMFRNLIPRLASFFRVIAPDYPGFGQTTMPDHKSFEYSFENLTNVVEKFTAKLGLTKFSIYVMDYGAPIGYRLALRHPEQIAGIIVQNGNAYDEGLLKFWDPIKKYWSEPTKENRQAIHFLTEPKATKWQYENGVSDTTLLDPTTWILDQLGMDRPGNDDTWPQSGRLAGLTFSIAVDQRAFSRCSTINRLPSPIFAETGSTSAQVICSQIIVLR